MSARKGAAKPAAKKPTAALRLTAAVERIADALAPRVIVTRLSSDRFVKVSADQKLLASSATEWVAVRDWSTNLTWTKGLLPGEFNHAEAIKAAQACRLFGCTDWDAPEILQRMSITAFDRELPAIDTNYFANESGWEWTKTRAPSGFAWLVFLGYGYSIRYVQGLRYHVRAVRAGQFSDIGL